MTLWSCRRRRMPAPRRGGRGEQRPARRRRRGALRRRRIRRSSSSYTETEEARRLAERVCELCRQLGVPHAASAAADHVTVSIGVAGAVAAMGFEPEEDAKGPTTTGKPCRSRRRPRRRWSQAPIERSTRPRPPAATASRAERPRRTRYGRLSPRPSVRWSRQSLRKQRDARRRLGPVGRAQSCFAALFIPSYSRSPSELTFLLASARC